MLDSGLNFPGTWVWPWLASHLALNCGSGLILDGGINIFWRPLREIQTTHPNFKVGPSLQNSRAEGLFQEARVLRQSRAPRLSSVCGLLKRIPCRDMQQASSEASW